MFQGILIMLAAYTIGGAITPTFTKIGVAEIPPLIFLFFRFLIATALFLIPFIKSRQKLTFSLFRHLWILLVLFAGNVIFFAFGIPHTTAVMSQILYTLTPIIVGIISITVFGEKLHRKQLVGTVVASIGILFLLSKSLGGGSDTTFGTIAGNALVGAAVTSWSLYFVLYKRLARQTPTIVVSFVSYVSTMVVTGLLSVGEWPAFTHKIAHVSQFAWVGVAVAGVLGTALMFYLMQIGVRRIGAVRGALFQYLTPFFAATTAIPLLHEKISPQLVLGGVCILAGVFYATSYDTVVRMARRRKN
jgi:drug/metabolite transporter (DMT)-like permease